MQIYSGSLIRTVNSIMETLSLLFLLLLRFVYIYGISVENLFSVRFKMGKNHFLVEWGQRLSHLDKCGEELCLSHPSLYTPFLCLLIPQFFLGQMYLNGKQCLGFSIKSNTYHLWPNFVKEFLQIGKEVCTARYRSFCVALFFYFQSWWNIS